MGYQKHLLQTFVLLAVGFAAVFFYPRVVLAIQAEEAVTREALEQSPYLEEDFTWVRSIEPLTNNLRSRRGVNTEIPMWSTDENDGYFTYQVRGRSARHKQTPNWTETYRVYYNRDGHDELQVYHIDRNPPRYH